VRWDPLDDRAVAAARRLALDAVEEAGHGHPGTAMALAPLAHLLFSHHLRHDPADPLWPGRDLFILSPGHASMLLYAQLHLTGYGLGSEDLRAFRRAGSRTPGHPERGHTPGVELTTGPLGQGLASAVGVALSDRYLRQLLDPAAAAGSSPFDRTVYVIASDGDLMEGLTAEAASLAGLQRLGSLIVIWDDNRITIDGDTSVAFTEDVCARMAAYGWHVSQVPARPDGEVDVGALDSALRQARDTGDRPSFIRLGTTIAYPAPHARGTAAAHGAPLGTAEAALTRELLGVAAEERFTVEADVLDHCRQALPRGAAWHGAWRQQLSEWRLREPAAAALLEELQSGGLPAGWDEDLPEWPDGAQVATRKASNAVLAALVDRLACLWGGSADLAESNGTRLAGVPVAQPAGSGVPGSDPAGRYVHFGVREHAMGAMLNGAALSGLLRPFGATFLVFSDYMRPAVRLAALMGTPVTFIWTHDSIGLGEDGPTHQPVEHLWSLRAIPGFAVVRPADAHETRSAWQALLERREPVGLVLTRQAVPVLTGTQGAAGRSGVKAGGYVVLECSPAVPPAVPPASPAPAPEVILIGSGSEVALCCAAAELLATRGVSCRVVSMPCVEWFEASPPAWQEAVLPARVTVRLAVEAGSPLGWWRWVGADGDVMGVTEFGASADPATLFAAAGLTPAAIADRAEQLLRRAAELPSG